MAPKNTPRTTGKHSAPPGVRPGPPGASGETRWYIRWKLDGHDHKALIPAPTARDAADERERRLAGARPASGRASVITVHDAIAKFLPGRPTHTTRIQDKSNLGRFDREYGGRSLTSITTPELAVWLRGIRKVDGGEYGPATRGAFKRSLAALFGWACETGLAPSNPAAGVRLDSGRKVRGQRTAPEAAKRHYDLGELRRLFGALDADGVIPAHRLIFRTQFRMGLRISEACALQLPLLDWKTGEFIIDRAITQGEISPTKLGRRFSKYLSEPGRVELREWLDETPARDGYLIAKRLRVGERHPCYAPRNLSRTFARAMKAARVHVSAGTTTHGLRHSWYEIGRDLGAALSDADIAEVLGNRASTAAQYYASGPGLMAKRIADHL